MVRPPLILPFILALSLVLAGCAAGAQQPAEPSSIYAKLAPDVRARLDREVEVAIRQNPDLF
jgi:hypothetical protein